jgi:23S rRNA (guanosine2251-2'-O)-methyltransferase
MARRGTTDETLVVTGANVVRELLASTQPVERVWVRGGAAGDLPARAAARRIPLESVGPDVLARLAPGGAHQGVVARLPTFHYADLDEVAGAAGRAVVVVDGVQDPYNLGAILRTARAAGVAGVVIPKDRASGVTAVVASASAGHVFGVRVARVTNVVRSCEALKEAGWWLVALVAGAARDVFGLAGDVDRPALVIGGEGSGIRPLVRERCDFAASIPMAPGVESLNVSVAAGIALYALTHRAPRH